MRRIRLWGLVAMGVVAAGCRQGAAPAVVLPPTPEVQYMLPVAGMVTDVVELPGLTDARITVQVRSRVSGYITKVYFKDGSTVEENDTLFEVDPRPYRAELERAEGNVAQIEAHRKRLEHEYERAKKLYSSRSISLEEFERYEGDYREAEANLKVARANRDLAKLDLEWTEIRAPASGLLSRRLVDPGNLIKADDTILTSIVTQDPMYVYFDVDERNTLLIRRKIRNGEVKARSEKEVPVLVGLSDEDDFPHEGIVDFTDNRVDVNTGSLRFRAIVSNPKGLLTPGLFARVRIPIGDQHPTLFVKDKAIASDQGKKIVYVVEVAGPADAVKTRPQGAYSLPAGEPRRDQSTAAAKAGQEAAKLAGKIVTREVTTGPLRNGYRAIEKGLSAGDIVVVEGLQRIHLGSEVVATRSPEKVQAPADLSFHHSGGRSGQEASKAANQNSSP